MIPPNEPIYYGHKDTSQEGKVWYFHLSPNQWWVEIHGVNKPIVPLRVRERIDGDPESNYWGWLDTKKPDTYTMIWPSKMQLDMCFPYGPDAETALGRGRCVNLMVEEIEE